LVFLIEEHPMSTTVTMEEAQAHLPELVARLAGGEELIITQDQKPVAKLVRESLTGRQPRKPGNCKGLMTIVSDDDEHLKDFEEYM
jgi:antitoxin (DNA-binding transcriptional repressor) of toxin-antitoxin stability system